MNYNQKISIGILLTVVSLFFYILWTVYQNSVYAHRNDFAHLYIAGYLAERGGDVFDPQLALKVHEVLQIPTGLNPFVYPPFFAILLIPLNWFTYDGAWMLFSALSQLAFFGSMVLLIRIVQCNDDPPIFWWGILLALSACYNPLVKNFAAGQMNTFVLLVLCGSWYLLQRRREIQAGALIGFGAAVKITPVFILLYFLWKGKWKTSLTGFIVILLSVLISLTLLGAPMHTAFCDIASQMGYGSSTWSQYGQHYHVEPHNQAPSALWYRLLTSNPSTIGVIDSPSTAKVLSYLSALLLLGILLWVTPRTAMPPSLWEYALWSFGMLMIPSLMWDHYLVQMLFAVAVALQIALNGNCRGVIVLAFGVALLAVPYYLDFPPFKSGWMTLVMSLKLYGMLLVFAFFLLNRPKNSTTPRREDSFFID